MTTHQPPQRGRETLDSAERPERLIPAAGIPADFVAELALTLAADGLVPEDQAPQVARVCAGLLRVAADGVAPEVAKLTAERNRFAAAVERIRALRDDWYRRPGHTENADALDEILDDAPHIDTQEPR